MVCSSCGFENDGTTRFCGMCGTPLPYRPLTTPEAQSTLKYTRLPLEDAGDTREHAAKPVSSSATMVLPERRAGGNGKPISTTTIAANPQPDADLAQARSTLDPQARQTAVVDTTEQPSIVEPPEPELEALPTRERASHLTQPDWRPRDPQPPVVDHASQEPAPAQPIEPQLESLPAPTELTSVPTEAQEPPPKDMVPDVPFDEYLRSFHYEPPSEATEVTMRGDASVADQRVPENPVPDVVSPAHPRPHVSSPSMEIEAEPQHVSTFRDEAEHVSSLSREDKMPAEFAPASAASHDVEDRLGLDAEAAPEVVERPRFLDIHEPVEADDRAKSGTSTIVGPSFLGLSDAPEIGESAGYEDEDVPRKSHWRGWLAAAVVVVFAGLGYMEWRTQVNQTDNGPVEIMKTKIRSWTNGGAAPASETAPANPPAASNTKPDMQVQEQPKPRPPSQTGNSNAPGAAGETSRASAPPPPASTPPTQTDSTKTGASSSQEPARTKPAEQSPSNATSAGNQSPPPNSAQAAPEKAKSDRASTASGDRPAGKAGAGADELKKAANASDSAAAAAWLWKSTAKGNPDAPVQLADMYIKGEGVPRSCEQAMVLLKTAAEKENARARNRLASLYASGNCVQRNRVEAYRWLSSALVANPHSDWAQQNKELLWNQMTPDERVMAAKYR